MANVYIGLGSNLNDPVMQITRAVIALQQLSDTTVTAISSCYLSKPHGFAQQPDFVNAVVELATQLVPLELLARLQMIEAQQLRVREQRNGPRTIDLDILLYDDQVIASERLTVPHPRLKQREFVIYPLYEIAPMLCLPSGEALSTLCTNCAKNDLQHMAMINLKELL